MSRTFVKKLLLGSFDIFQVLLEIILGSRRCRRELLLETIRDLSRYFSRNCSKDSSWAFPEIPPWFFSGNIERALPWISIRNLLRSSPEIQGFLQNNFKYSAKQGFIANKFWGISPSSELSYARNCSMHSLKNPSRYSTRRFLGIPLEIRFRTPSNISPDDRRKIIYSSGNSSTVFFRISFIN